MRKLHERICKNCGDRFEHINRIKQFCSEECWAMAIVKIRPHTEEELVEMKFSGMSFKTMSKDLGVTPARVAKHYHRATMRLAHPNKKGRLKKLYMRLKPKPDAHASFWDTRDWLWKIR